MKSKYVVALTGFECFMPNQLWRFLIQKVDLEVIQILEKEDVRMLVISSLV
jgi:hypothetical protein